MWVARVSLNGEKALIGSRCKKFSVSISGYPVSIIKGKKLDLYAIYFVFGEEENVKQFLKDLRKDKRVVHLENKMNFVFSHIREPIKHSPAYDPSIIHLEPLRINEDGIEFWTIGSWNRKALLGFISLVEKSHEAKLLSIKKEFISNFFVLSMSPPLTHSQKKALELALRSGYYHYPREVDLKNLAQACSLSYATYHAHLRKAEYKMLSHLFGKLN
jgi:predicted DNA binding protein